LASLTCDTKLHLNKSKLLVSFLLLIVQLILSDCLVDRKKVLKHHPDKKASGPNAAPTTSSIFLNGVSQNTNDDAFFKCIQKAHEVLTNTERRRQFDSVDPVFMELEEDMPTAVELKVSLGVLEIN
jgi:hypothetical protein